MIWRFKLKVKVRWYLDICLIMNRDVGLFAFDWGWRREVWGRVVEGDEWVIEETRRVFQLNFKLQTSLQRNRLIPSDHSTKAFPTEAKETSNIKISEERIFHKPSKYTTSMFLLNHLPFHRKTYFLANSGFQTIKKQALKKKQQGKI